MVRFGAVGAPVVLLPPEEQPLFARRDSDVSATGAGGLHRRARSRSDSIGSPRPGGYGSISRGGAEGEEVPSQTTPTTSTPAASSSKGVSFEPGPPQVRGDSLYGFNDDECRPYTRGASVAMSMDISELIPSTPPPPPRGGSPRGGGGVGDGHDHDHDHDHNHGHDHLHGRSHERTHSASIFEGSFLEGSFLEGAVETTLETLAIETDVDDDGPCLNPLHDHDHLGHCHSGHGAEGDARDVGDGGVSGPEPHPVGPHGASAHQHLKLLPLAVLVFYNVSGGPFGIEETVRSGGNLFAILGFAIAPLIFSVPEALVTAELGSAFPEAAGGAAWAEEAFGPRAGLMCGYLNWIAGATDNAIYPSLFVEYVTSAVSAASGGEVDKGELASGWGRFAYVSGLTAVLAGVNYTGLEIVGASSVVVCVLAMSPFVVMTIVGLPKIDPAKWLQMPDGDVGDLFDDDGEMAPGPITLAALGGVLWRPYLNNLFWNLNSFDAAASFAGEVRDIPKTYPPGIFLGLALTVVCYLIPLMVATGATDSEQGDWVDGHLAAVATEIGGMWLGGWTVFAAGISNLALFEAEMSADAYQLMGMAQRGYLPKVFSTRSRYGTPMFGILLGTAVIVAFSVADFGKLVEMLNLNYAISLLMEYAAFVKLRYSRGDVERPYRVPIPDWAAILLVIPPCAAIALIFLISSWLTLLFVAMVLALGVGLYRLQQLAIMGGWCEFAPMSGYGPQVLSLPDLQHAGGMPTVAEGEVLADGGLKPQHGVNGGGGDGLFRNEDGVVT